MTTIRTSWITDDPHSAAAILRQRGMTHPMCSSHQPDNGADSLVDALQSFPENEAEAWSEYAAVGDNTCDRCGRDVYGTDRLYSVTVLNKLRWYCAPCFDRWSDWFAGGAA